MTDELPLLERLRTKYCCTTEDCNCDEAADRIEAQAAEIERLRKPKTVTVTVVSAYDRKAMNTFKINPAEKTYVRPDHSMFGYVFEPEE